MRKMPKSEYSPASGSPGLTGWALAASWFGIMTAGPVAFWGYEQLLVQPPAFLTMLGAVAIYPAVGLLMIAGAWRTAWMASHRIEAAIGLAEAKQAPAAPVVERVVETQPAAAPPPLAAPAPAAKTVRARPSRTTTPPAIQGFADDDAPSNARAARPRRRSTASAAPEAVEAPPVAAPQPAPRIAQTFSSMSMRVTIAPPSEATVAPEPEQPPRTAAKRAARSTEPAIAEPPPRAEPPVRGVVDLTAMRRRRGRTARAVN